MDRIIGLVSVTLDTAGSFQAEGKLPSIRTEVADHLRASVAALRPGLEDDVVVGDAGEAGATDAEGLPTDAGADAYSGAAAGVRTSAAARMAARPNWGRILLKLGPADMFRIGLANRNFIFVAAMVGILTDLLQPGNFLDPLLEALAAGVDSAAGAFSGLGALAQLVVVVVLILGFLAVALLLTVTAAFLRHHDFTLWHDGRTFRSRAGLLTQREVVVEAPKIQQLSVSQDLVQRWFGRFRLRALPAAAVVAQGGQSPSGLDVADVLDVPLLDGPRADELRARVFRREAREIAVLPRDGAFKRVSSHYIRALTLRISAHRGPRPRRHLPAAGAVRAFRGRGLADADRVARIHPGRGAHRVAALAAAGIRARRRRVGEPRRVHRAQGGRVPDAQGPVGNREAVAAAAPQGAGNPAGPSGVREDHGALHRARGGAEAAGLHPVQGRGVAAALALKRVRRAVDMTTDPANASEFSRWRRTSPFAIVFFVRVTIRQIDLYAQLLVSLGLAFLLVRARELAGDLIPVAILVIVVVAVLRYWFFRFRVTGDRILIRQGILKKTALDLPMDRIQAVNVQRSLTDRLLGLVTVSVDTAGSGAVEAVIPSVRAVLADRIRAEVSAVRREGCAREVEADGPVEGLASQVTMEHGSPGEVMMTLPPGDMVRIGLRGAGDYRWLVLLLVFLVRDPRDLLRYTAGQLGILEPIGRDQVPRDFVSSLADLIFRFGVVGALLTLIAALGIYGAFKTYFGFKLYRDGATYRTRAGLFTQREVVVQSVKVQQATLSQNIVDRCFRRFRLTVQPVSDEAEVLEIPLLGARMAETLRARLFGREGRGLTLLPQSRGDRAGVGALHRCVDPEDRCRPRAGRLRSCLSIYRAIRDLGRDLPHLGAHLCPGGGAHRPSALAPAGVLARRRRHCGAERLRRPQCGCVPFRKVQSVTVKQSPMQRAMGLATLEMELSGEIVEVPYIKHGVACRLRDYILYKVESNPRWH